jgi:hypothetical protein
MKLKKHELKKKKASPREPLNWFFKPWLISKTCNPWNPRLRFNKETQFRTYLMLNDEIEKNINFKNYLK